MRFSSGVKHTSIRLVLAIVTQGDRKVEQLDVKTFLHGELEERIYMKQPKGFLSGRSRKQSVLSRSPFMG